MLRINAFAFAIERPLSSDYVYREQQHGWERVSTLLPKSGPCTAAAYWLALPDRIEPPRLS